MSVLELAKKYYPRLWNEERIQALVAAGRLSREEADEVTGRAAGEDAARGGEER